MTNAHSNAKYPPRKAKIIEKLCKQTNAHTRKEHTETNAHLRKAVRLRHIQKLKGLHLKPESAVNQQQHQIGGFGHVAHCIEVVRALEDREAPLLAWRRGSVRCKSTVTGVKE